MVEVAISDDVNMDVNMYFVHEPLRCSVPHLNIEFSWWFDGVSGGV